MTLLTFDLAIVGSIAVGLAYIVMICRIGNAAHRAQDLYDPTKQDDL